MIWIKPQPVGLPFDRLTISRRPALSDAANDLADIAANQADVGEHAIVDPIEDVDGLVAATPLADRSEDVFHNSGSLPLRGFLSVSRGMRRSMLRCRICMYSPRTLSNAKLVHQPCGRGMAIGDRESGIRNQVGGAKDLSTPGLIPMISGRGPGGPPSDQREQFDRYDGTAY